MINIGIFGEGVKYIIPIDFDNWDAFERHHYAFKVSETEFDGIFDRVRMTVAPLRYGAGIKGKVIDSLAAGVPCVGTPIAAEGLDLPARLLGLFADSAEEIAELICRLYRDDEEHEGCAEAGRRFVREAFSAPQIDRLMRAVTACNSKA